MPGMQAPEVLRVRPESLLRIASNQFKSYGRVLQTWFVGAFDTGTFAPAHLGGRQMDGSAPVRGSRQNPRTVTLSEIPRSRLSRTPSPVVGCRRSVEENIQKFRE